MRGPPLFIGCAMAIFGLWTGEALCQQGQPPQTAPAPPPSATGPQAPAAPVGVKIDSPIHLQLDSSTPLVSIPPSPPKGIWESSVLAAAIAAAAALIGVLLSFMGLNRTIKANIDNSERQITAEFAKLETQVSRQIAKEARDLEEKKKRYLSVIWSEAFLIKALAFRLRGEVPKKWEGNMEPFIRLKMPRLMIFSASLEELSLLESTQLLIWLPVLRHIIERIDRRVEYLASTSDKETDQKRDEYITGFHDRLTQCGMCAEKIVELTASSLGADEKRNELVNWFGGTEKGVLDIAASNRTSRRPV